MLLLLETQKDEASQLLQWNIKKSCLKKYFHEDLEFPSFAEHKWALTDAGNAMFQ